jgi:hypothetical protein
MKTAAKITGGAQSLLPVSFDIQSIFEEYLSVEYKAFLRLLQVVEPYILRTEKSEGGRGRPPYKACCFIRGELAKRRFHIDKTGGLINPSALRPEFASFARV